MFPRFKFALRFKKLIRKKMPSGSGRSTLNAWQRASQCTCKVFGAARQGVCVARRVSGKFGSWMVLWRERRLRSSTSSAKILIGRTASSPRRIDAPGAGMFCPEAGSKFPLRYCEISRNFPPDLLRSCVQETEAIRIEYLRAWLIGRWGWRTRSISALQSMQCLP